MSETFKITQPKTVYEKYFVDIELVKWLRGEIIQAISFSAKDIETGASADVVDSIKSTSYQTIAKPYIKDGTSGKSYRVSVKVETLEQSCGEFYLEFSVKDK
jgi:hypothetical protein